MTNPMDVIKVRMQHGAHSCFVCRVNFGSLRARGAATRRSVGCNDCAACQSKHMHTWNEQVVAGLATTMAFASWGTACPTVASTCGSKPTMPQAVRTELASH